MTEKTKPPNLNDMFLAGLPLREAVLLERNIEAHPEVDSSQWWALLVSEEFCLRFPSKSH